MIPRQVDGRTRAWWADEDSVCFQFPLSWLPFAAQNSLFPRQGARDISRIWAPKFKRTADSPTTMANTFASAQDRKIANARSGIELGTKRYARTIGADDGRVYTTTAIEPAGDDHPNSPGMQIMNQQVGAVTNRQIAVVWKRKNGQRFAKVVCTNAKGGIRARQYVINAGGEQRYAVRPVPFGAVPVENAAKTVFLWEERGVACLLDSSRYCNESDFIRDAGEAKKEPNCELVFGNVQGVTALRVRTTQRIWGGQELILDRSGTRFCVSTTGSLPALTRENRASWGHSGRPERRPSGMTWMEGSDSGSDGEEEKGLALLLRGPLGPFRHLSTPDMCSAWMAVRTAGTHAQACSADATLAAYWASVSSSRWRLSGSRAGLRIMSSALPTSFSMCVQKRATGRTGDGAWAAKYTVAGGGGEAIWSRRALSSFSSFSKATAWAASSAFLAASSSSSSTTLTAGAAVVSPPPGRPPGRPTRAAWTCRGGGRGRAA
eukprot:jgi/Mesvir1/10622/Mv01155-RA.1